ncbi:MAG: HAD-IA family hydrolase [Burkholderiaceae bacterium]|nr:HAD-IA family hydrolase [Burkholderiaceae bacterium]
MNAPVRARTAGDALRGTDGSLPLRAVFFDLDGTLADTAADLVAPVQSMRQERGLAPLPFEALRPYASMGARGLLLGGLGVERDAPAFEALRDEFLQRYEAAMNVHTCLFPGISEVLDALDRAAIPWGVVSNKIERLVRPILGSLGVLDRAVCAIGGDTTGFAKPHPEPLLHGARIAGVEASACVYVGDDLRDIVAGRAAHMRTVAAAYGFCGEASPPHSWGADALVHEPRELLALLGFVT